MNVLCLCSVPAGFIYKTSTAQHVPFLSASPAGSSKQTPCRALIHWSVERARDLVAAGGGRHGMDHAGPLVLSAARVVVVAPG